MVRRSIPRLSRGFLYKNLTTLSTADFLLRRRLNTWSSKLAKSRPNQEPGRQTNVARMILRPVPRLWRLSPKLAALDPTQERSPVGQSGAPADREAHRARKQQDAAGQAAHTNQQTDTSQQKGDPDELHRLVVEHGDAIYRLALSVVRDKSLAEDVAQETLVKAWLALPSFRGDSSLRGWVLRIAHNTAISTLRTRRAVVIDPHDLPERESRPERSVESKVQSDAVMSEFVEALETLDDLSRSIVVLRELEGLSYEEIAEVLNVPMPTVKTRLLRARRRLGSVLREWS